MNVKYTTLILTFLSTFIFGQLKLDFVLIDSVAKITIFNNSDKKYVFPLDKKNVRPYEKTCDSFNDFESEFPSFGLMTNIFNSSGKREDYTVGYKKFDNLNSIEKNIKVKRKKLKTEIMKWGKANGIKDYSVAFVNYNLINNLIYLSPHEKVSFNIKIDLYNITNQELIFYNYLLKKTDNYNFSLTSCEYNNFDKYLTSSQKKKLSNYNFFYGKLESNMVQWK